MPNHVLTIKIDVPHGAYADMDVSIECPGVTDACAEWVECPDGDCPGYGGRDDEFEDGNRAHGEEHRNIDGAWMIRSGFCFAENHGHDAAGQMAERLSLGIGRYEVIPEFDDGTLNDFVLVATRPKPMASPQAEVDS